MMSAPARCRAKFPLDTFGERYWPAYSRPRKIRPQRSARARRGRSDEARIEKSRIAG